VSGRDRPAPRHADLIERTTDLAGPIDTALIHRRRREQRRQPAPEAISVCLPPSKTNGRDHLTDPLAADRWVLGEQPMELGLERVDLRARRGTATDGGHRHESGRRRLRWIPTRRPSSPIAAASRSARRTTCPTGWPEACRRRHAAAVLRDRSDARSVRCGGDAVAASARSSAAPPSSSRRWPDGRRPGDRAPRSRRPLRRA
jgi:hypothetical protein